ncbi:MAG: hypothetical protein IE926_01935 [Micrococcales bacterium]|nr:hypothetical protein [Micrococcales bacterium]
MDVATAVGSLQRRGDRRPWVVARLVGSPNPTTNRATVTIDGSEKVSLPYVPGSYAGVTLVYVLRDPDNTGMGPLILGPAYTEVAPPPPPADAPPADQPSTTTVTALIRPSYSGSYRTSVSAWDRWNVNRLGGRSTVWQGNQYGSGPMLGFAGYGTQVRDLGALSIQRIRVLTPLVKYSGSIVLQGSSSGTKPGGAPSSSGATASGVTAVDLTAAMCEAFRTGATRGLVAVGSAYRATYGTGHPSGMALQVTYTRRA